MDIFDRLKSEEKVKVLNKPIQLKVIKPTKEKDIFDIIKEELPGLLKKYIQPEKKEVILSNEIIEAIRKEILGIKIPEKVVEKVVEKTEVVKEVPKEVKPLMFHDLVDAKEIRQQIIEAVKREIQDTFEDRKKRGDDQRIIVAPLPLPEMKGHVGHYLTVENSNNGLVARWAEVTGSSVGVLNDLTDVDDSSRAKNYALLFNGTEWVAAPQGTSYTFEISTFTDNQDATVEMGSAGGAWKTAGQLTFSATYTNGPASGSYVSHTGWTNLTMTNSYEGPTSNTQNATYPAAPGTKTWTLNSTDGTDNDTATITIAFYNRRFWGVSSKASGYAEADVEGLANNELSNSKAKTFTITAGAGEYIIYAFPSRLGTATFTVGGFEGGFQSPETVSITNASGFTENFYVYRSTNSNLGSTTVVAS